MAEGSELKETIERLKHNPLVRALLANTRAEVLAACVEATRKFHDPDCITQYPPMSKRPCDCEAIKFSNHLRRLQPAASALEGLLQEKELNAWDDALAFVWNTLSKTSAEEMKPIHHKQFEIQRQLAKLEKARAEEEKP